MPTYDYLCENCQQSFEIFQSMSDEPLRRCPSCEQDTMQRLISAGAGIIFKGSGYYVNDSRSSRAGSSAGDKAGSAGKESGTSPASSKTTDKTSKESSKGETTKTA